MKERLAVSEAYKSRKWRERVRKMTDEQVLAIYLNLKRQGKVA